MKNRECVKCGELFDPMSARKAHAGGKVNECPDCSEETAVRHLGLQSGDGKGVGVTVLAFDDARSREVYRDAWMQSSGMYKGKVCQMSNRSPSLAGLSFKRLYEAGIGMNHKGKA